MAKTGCYELCFILRDDASKETTEEVHHKILSLVKDHEGSIEAIDEWPVRTLCFPIKKQSKGRYTFVQIKGGADVLPPLKKALRYNEAVLRFEFFRYPDSYDYHNFKKRMSAWDATWPT